MNNIRKFFSFTKYFWIGGIMGFIQQILGGLNYEIFNFLPIYQIISHTMHFIPKIQRKSHISFRKPMEKLLGFFWWTAIGTAAAVWAFFATKFHNKDWKKRYILMLAPLFAVLITEFANSAVCMILYIIQECSKNNLSDSFRRGSSLGTPLTDLVGLIICSVIYLKKEKTDIQTKGTI